MPKGKGHPLDSLTFTAPKLEEAQSQVAAPKPASTKVTGTPGAAQEAPDTAPDSVEEPEARASNVTLPVTVWEWIDHKHAEARTNGGRPLRKAAIIRAVFAVAMAVEVDLAGAQSDEEMAARLLRRAARVGSAWEVAIVQLYNRTESRGLKTPV